MATTTGGTATAIPIGYRFLPTDKELIVDYLANRVAGKPVPSTAVVEADVYGTEPWNLLRNGDQEGYFFAMRKRKNAVGTRVDRRAGTGTWTLYSKKEESVTTLDAEGREIAVGCKSSLSFNDGKSKYSGWIMHEYELVSVAGVFQTQVLCHIKNRAGKMKKRSAADIPTTRPHESALSPECTTQTPPKRSYEAANFPSALFPECTAQPPPKRSQPHEAALFSECTEQPPAKRVCNWQLPMFLEPSPSSCDEDQAFYAQLLASLVQEGNERSNLLSASVQLSPSSCDEDQTFCTLQLLAPLVPLEEENEGSNFLSPWMQLSPSPCDENQTFCTQQHLAPLVQLDEENEWSDFLSPWVQLGQASDAFGSEDLNQILLGDEFDI
ncbi:NAC domain-containing protein 48-like [Zingiber officinale]|uniref:NAC domain-containing protein 48-like n=1 Tax=Zingiber officinale TaxID=94328 RepID=UPI001C4D69B0|nr:NAC domain-containing protein 48-like [Zingiber officinale]